MNVVSRVYLSSGLVSEPSLRERISTEIKNTNERRSAAFSALHLHTAVGVSARILLDTPIQDNIQDNIISS